MDKDNRDDGLFFLMGFIGCIIGILVAVLYYESLPSAMDVYNHKTTLKYTVIGGKKIDSTVVYKNSYKYGE